MNLILIRGLPGSGKSTFAHTLIQNFNDAGTRAVHLEADMFFLVGGVYLFQANLIGEAHKWCIEKSRLAIQKGFIPVVANTFTTNREMFPYLSMAREHNISVIVHEMTASYGSIHDVPAATIERMKLRWEKYHPL